MNQKISFVIVGIIIGLLMVIQFRSYDQVTGLLERDGQSKDAFHELYVLKTATESLKEDILASELQLIQYADQTSAYNTLLAEIKKNEILIGDKPISGPGIQLIVDAPISMPTMIDIVNEMWAAGAEAVMINEHRLTELNNSFYSLDQRLLLGGDVIMPPYQIEAIGNGEALYNILSQPGSIVSRLSKEYSANAIILHHVSQGRGPKD